MIRIILHPAFNRRGQPAVFALEVATSARR